VLKAGKLGALAVIVRVNLRLDDLPHTGATNYGDCYYQRIPAAISTNGAELLSKSLKTNCYFYLKQSCQTYDDVLSIMLLEQKVQNE
jgi:hypothetical protein